MRTTANLPLLSDVRRLQARHQIRYGSPRMHAAPGLRRGRICTTDSRRNLPIAPNLLAQRFMATAPDRIWLADITYTSRLAKLSWIGVP
jgi:putative transposase